MGRLGVSGTARGAVSLIARISRISRGRASAALATVRHSEDNFRLLFDGHPQPMFVWDLATLAFLEVNDAATRLYGYSREEFLTMRIIDIRPAEDVAALMEWVSGFGMRSGTRSAGRWKHRLKGGRVIDVEVTVQRLSFGGRSAVLSQAQDVTERNALVDQLQHQAFHDPLTSLPNRGLFCDRVEHARARSRRSKRPFAILLFDLDNFKAVNDSFGHIAGDELLLSVAVHLSECLRSGDTVARFGGDEFAILVEDISATSDASLVAERILAVLQEPVKLTGGREATVGASVGIAVAGDGDGHDEVGELLRKADVAMYRAKQRGRGRVELFESSMSEHVVARMETEQALRRGIAAGELEVFYQAVVDLADTRIHGAEALVRWRHPQRGLLLPEVFIELAEESGLIVALERWVLEEACRQTVRWRREMPTDPPLCISVNVSPRHLSQPAFVDHIVTVLSATGMDPACLLLEITERAAVEAFGAAMRALWQLRELGVRLSIDDFGTGFSSLSYLKRFPWATLLKIDKSFVDGLSTNPADAAIVRAIVAMASAVGLRTVAEGVETPEQLSEVIGLGCDFAQGYLFARPMPAEQFTDMLVEAGNTGLTPGRQGRAPHLTTQRHR